MTIMKVNKCILFLLVATIVPYAARRREETNKNLKLIETEEETKFKNVLDPIILEKFKQCECNEDRIRVIEEMGLLQLPKEMRCFYDKSLAFKLHKYENQFMLTGRNPDMPQYLWFELDKPFVWWISDKELSVEVKQHYKQLIQIQTWTDPNGEKKTATTSYEFSFGNDMKDQRMKMVTNLDKLRAVCIYQVGRCPKGYRVD